MNVAEEHYATEVTRQVLDELAPRMRVQPSGGRLAIVTGSPGEQHVLGARMVADFLEADGWEVLQLGARPPRPTSPNWPPTRHPTSSRLSTATARSLPDIADVLGRLSALRPRPLLAVGGQVWTAESSRTARDLGADLVATDPRMLVAALRERVRRAASQARRVAPEGRGPSQRTISSAIPTSSACRAVRPGSRSWARATRLSTVLRCVKSARAAREALIPRPHVHAQGLAQLGVGARHVAQRARDELRRQVLVLRDQRDEPDVLVGGQPQVAGHPVHEALGGQRVEVAAAKARPCRPPPSRAPTRTPGGGASGRARAAVGLFGGPDPGPQRRGARHDRERPARAGRPGQRVGGALELPLVRRPAVAPEHRRGVPAPSS